MKTRDFFATILAGFALSWFWFRPVFWDMSNGANSYIEALHCIFMSTDISKNNIGAGIDYFGTLWIFAQAEQIILEGQSSIIDNLYYPTGFDLGKNTGFGWGDALYIRD